ncbi:MAG: SDR family NAD(P)-dependent oxidoreductase [Alphaproteobacteria bacterium]
MSSVAVVLGVGASRGLGAALARRFARGGHHVIVSGRTKDKLDRIVDEIRDAAGSAEARTADVTVEADMEALFAHAETVGPLGAVLYNAGNNAIISFDDLDADTFETFWRICCLGGFHTAKAALPRLEAHGGGSLLFTGASASLRGKARFAHFASAKAALRNLAQALAREYGPRGIHVGHVIVDGVIDGDMVRSRFGEYLDRLGADGTLNPDEIAEAFWHLHTQHRSAWTHELDVRPFKENW